MIFLIVFPSRNGLTFRSQRRRFNSCELPSPARSEIPQLAVHLNGISKVSSTNSAVINSQGK